MDLQQINPEIFGNPEEIKAHLSEYLEALRESPKAEARAKSTPTEKRKFLQKRTEGRTEFL